MGADPALRRAVEADRPALNRLMHASSAYHGRYRAMLQGYEITAEQIARDEVWLAERDGELLGFYSLITTGEPELDLMFVADAAQGLGLGARLFEHMAQRAKAAGVARVRIVSNPPAAAFYERMGARRAGVVPPRGRIDWDRPALELRLED